jgi:exopolysaccharide/PEP-CTERM locus tyrosine autokinase
VSIIEKAAAKLGWVRIKPGDLENRLQPNASQVHAEPVAADRQYIRNAGQHEISRNNPHNDAVSQEQSTGTARPSQVAIDLNRLHQLGIITPHDDKSRIAEEFRLIKRPLILNAFDHSEGQFNNGNLIMVTSALAGEGKSFCAVNLAMSIAMEMDHTVLLIDADVARPSIPGYLGLKPGPGLLDVLLDDNIELSEVIMRTNVEKLSVILSGQKNRHATELLASQNMKDLLTDIAHRYQDRIIIFDSPPLLLTTESRALATQMGQIVMVVASETTPQKSVMEALRQIESCSDVKLIYNKARSFISNDPYNYY